MAVPIIDKRFLPKNQSTGSRGKFIDRYKGEIKRRIRDIVEKESIKDVVKGDKKIKIDPDNLSEPEFEFLPNTGKSERVYNGNKKFNKDDQIQRPDKDYQQGGGGSGNGDDTEDDFEFLLTEKEFSDLFFDDLALPDLLKKEFLGVNWEIQHAGYSKNGGPAALNIKKTLLNSLYRRIAIRNRKKLLPDDKKIKTPFIDDVDLRYNFKERMEIPSTRAVMFMLMDVSGSMGERQKDFAKRFFILLNLFLRRNYKIVDLVFIRHTDIAEEVDEKTFFYDRKSGGTIISSGYEKISDIIKDRYDASMWNIYIAQASDGDNFDSDNEHMENVLITKLLPIVQYMAYINVVHDNLSWLQRNLKSEVYDILDRVANTHKNLQVRQIDNYHEIISVFRTLFKKKDK